MRLNWFTLASLVGFVALGVVTVLLVVDGHATITHLTGIVGLGAMTITASVLSLHFKDD